MRKYLSNVIQESCRFCNQLIHHGDVAYYSKGWGLLDRKECIPRYKERWKRELGKKGDEESLLLKEQLEEAEFEEVIFRYMPK